MNSPLDNIIRQLEEERRRLDREFKIELPKAIGTAREHGDLSENAEYHAAREKHGMVRARMAQIDGQLANLRGIDLDRLPHDKVGLYTTVRLFDVEAGVEVSYRLVTSEEADLEQGRISVGSPIGRSLLGRGEGDQVSVQVPSGRRTFEVVAVVTLHDAATAAAAGGPAGGPAGGGAGGPGGADGEAGDPGGAGET